MGPSWGPNWAGVRGRVLPLLSPCCSLCCPRPVLPSSRQEQRSERRGEQGLVFLGVWSCPLLADREPEPLSRLPHGPRLRSRIPPAQDEAGDSHTAPSIRRPLRGGPRGGWDGGHVSTQPLQGPQERVNSGLTSRLTCTACAPDSVQGYLLQKFLHSKRPNRM